MEKLITTFQKPVKPNQPGTHDLSSVHYWNDLGVQCFQVTMMNIYRKALLELHFASFCLNITINYQIPNESGQAWPLCF
jgi:hypothetical protein